MPKLNEIYKEYGCNKGQLVLIMDGVNVYHDEMAARYKDSLGGIFPMLCIQDNLDSLNYLKLDFPGAAPTYGLVNPLKQILHKSRTFSEFKAVLDSLKLKKQPELCDGITGIFDELPEIMYGRRVAVSVTAIRDNSLLVQVNQPGEYSIAIYTLKGRLVCRVSRANYEKGICTLSLQRAIISKGGYTISIEQNGIRRTQKVVFTN